MTQQKKVFCRMPRKSPEYVVRAGIIPYYEENGNLYFQFMVPSDPKFGGDKPQIAKGQVSSKESLLAEAIREAHEELGLRISNVNNFVKVWEKNFHTGEFHVWVANIFDLNDYDAYGYETGHTLWLCENEIAHNVRKDHTYVVFSAIKKIRSRKSV